MDTGLGLDAAILGRCHKLGEAVERVKRISILEAVIDCPNRELEFIVRYTTAGKPAIGKHTSLKYDLFYDSRSI
jgi:hypothetical protein